MIPDLKKAAEQGEFTIYKFKVNLNDIDPLPILEALPNVLMISYDSSYEPISIPNPMFASDNLDSFTLVNKKDGKLQYIIVYNQSLSQDRLRLALSRELGHVILNHDGTSPEFVWNEEASCFAHHFLCPLCKLEEERRKERNRKIYFKPKLGKRLWEEKSRKEFDDIESLQGYIAYEQSKEGRWVGDKDCFYLPSDVKIVKRIGYVNVDNWENYSDVIVDGKTVGCCGN